MPVTYNLIASNTLSSAAASVTFSAIPQTYTDLVVRVSARVSDAAASYYIRLQPNSGFVTSRRLEGDGSSATSATNSLYTMGFVVGGGSDANTFNSGEWYLPNYAGSTTKPISMFTVNERNNTAANMAVNASLYNSTSAITSIELTNSDTNFVSGSSFFLYGIKNS